jgi:hypothetical protein
MTTHAYIVSETAISSIINIVIGMVAMLLIFGVHPAVLLWGTGGLAVNLIPAIFMMALMDVIVPTLLTRMRIRRGRLLVGSETQQSWIPTSLLLRALLLAVAVTTTLLPCTLILMYGWGPAVWTLWGLLTSQVVLGVLVAAIVIPLAMKAAFNDFRRTSL